MPRSARKAGRGNGRRRAPGRSDAGRPGGEQDSGALQRKIHTLTSLLEVGKKISSTLDLEEVLHRSFESVEEVLNAERSSVWRLNPGGRALSFFMARGEGLNEDALRDVTMKVGEGIVGHVAEVRKPLVIEDAPSDPRWSDKVDRQLGFHTRSILCVPLEAHGRLLGVIQLLNRKDGEAFTREDSENLQNLGAQIAVAMENASLYEEKRRTFFGLLALLAEVIERRDAYTGGHVQRVVSYSIAIGKQLNMRDAELDTLKMAAILHDIGKIGIEDRILNKPGKLTEEEENRMKEHVVIGSQILGSSPLLRDIVPGVRHHHERYDGTGYPDGLKGEQIPLEARIITVADTFDAMTTTRPYRTKLEAETALKELERFAGEQFCPEVVNAFQEALANEKIPFESGDSVLLVG